MLRAFCVGLWLLASVFACDAASRPCKLLAAKYGYVCVCSAEYCDYLDDPTPSADTDFVVVSSSKGGLRFATTRGQFQVMRKYFVYDYVNSTTPTQYEAAHEHVQLSLNRSVQYQRIVGFGGAYTGAVAYLVDKLSRPELQDQLYKSFYASSGIGFNLMRVTIGGCDFDLEPWSYSQVDSANDTSLHDLDSLNPHDVLRVKQIKRLREVSQVQNLRIKGAAWSPPKWMKTNKRWTGFGQLKRQYYQLWADYHLKWLELWHKHGLPIWAISTGNEPLNGILYMSFVKFMSLGWTPQQQAIWIADHLGPTLRNSKFNGTQLFSNDDQINTFPYWFQIMNSTRPQVLDYLDGLSLHWYFDDLFGTAPIDKTSKYLHDKLLIASESCLGSGPWVQSKPTLGSWKRGETYAQEFLRYFKHGYNAWIDWNLMLDEAGGPNYVNNTVDAPVVVNTTTFSEFYKQPIFYALGHFSKFVPEGSIRIDVMPSNDNVDAIAFLRPDDAIAAIISNSESAAVEINISDSVRGAIVLSVPPKSLHTLIYK